MPLLLFSWIVSNPVGLSRIVSDQIELSRIVLKVTHIKIVLKLIDKPHEKRYINSMKSNER